jgi:hypothetical protein
MGGSTERPGPPGIRCCGGSRGGITRADGLLADWLSLSLIDIEENDLSKLILCKTKLIFLDFDVSFEKEREKRNGKREKSIKNIKNITS